MNIFEGYSWDTDILPQILTFMSQDVIKFPLIFLIVASLGTWAAMRLLATWR